MVYQKRLFAQQDKIRDLETIHQQHLLESSIRAQERERQRIAHELHDGIGSLLSTIRLYVAQFSLQTSPELSQEILQDTKSIVDTAITQTREISHQLLPTTLSRFGVIQAIEDYCERLNALPDIAVTFSYDHPYSFPEQHGLALYRITQELLNNTLKHAQASQVQIQLQAQQNEELRLHYQDNGRGFDLVKTMEVKSGLGMSSIESRVNLLAGKMDIQSSVGNGFQFTLTFPHLAERV